MTRKFSDSKRGSALPVRVVPRADKNELVEILNDDIIKIRLASSPADIDMNKELIKFLSEILIIPQSKMEIVAGEVGRDKLVSILDLESVDIQRRILAKLIK